MDGLLLCDIMAHNKRWTLSAVFEQLKYVKNVSRYNYRIILCGQHRFIKNVNFKGVEF